MIVGGLEGAMLVARPYGDAARFQAAAASLLAGLLADPSEPAEERPNPAAAVTA
jgi:TetR/AcrR family transcriptional repressor of nem operon